MQGHIKRRSFLLADSTHRRLKEVAALHSLTLGGTIRRLLDAYEGKPAFSSKAYAEWIKAVCRIGRVNGDEAAAQFIKENPAPGWR